MLLGRRQEDSNWRRCPACGAWNTLQEVTIETGSGKKSAVSARAAAGKAKPLSELDTSEEIRFATGISEFDRVLGGGAVAAHSCLSAARRVSASRRCFSRCALRREMAEDTLLSPVRKVSVSSSARDASRRRWGEYLCPCRDGYRQHHRRYRRTEAGHCNHRLRPDRERFGRSLRAGQHHAARECTMPLMRVTKEKGLTVFRRWTYK